MRIGFDKGQWDGYQEFYIEGDLIVKCFFNNGVLVDYQEFHLDVDKLEKILEFSQIKGTILEVESKFDTSKLQSWSELKQLFSSLENRGVANIRINFGIVRGLDYYSGMVFEVFDKNSKLGALAGGGRYDSLTKAFGRDDIGAAGVAGGVERIMLTMQEQGIVQQTKQTRISVLYINEEMQKVAISIASWFFFKSDKVAFFPTTKFN